jgi:hypothetical protein
MPTSYDQWGNKFYESYGEVDDDKPYMPADLDWQGYNTEKYGYEQFLNDRRRELESTGGEGAAAMKSGLNQAQLAMQAQATGRGANPGNERAALYAGSQMQRQGALQGAQMTQAEYSQLAAMEDAYRRQNVQNAISQQAMEMQRQQMMSNNYNAAVGADIQQTNSDWSNYSGLVGTVVGAAAGAASDVRAKSNVGKFSESQADSLLGLLSPSYSQPFTDSASLAAPRSVGGAQVGTLSGGGQYLGGQSMDSGSFVDGAPADGRTVSTGFQAMYGGAPASAQPTGQDFSAAQYRGMASRAAASIPERNASSIGAAAAKGGAASMPDKTDDRAWDLIKELSDGNAAQKSGSGSSGGANSAQSMKAGLEAGMMLGSMVASDVRVKQGVSGATPQAQDQLMRAADLYSFDYRPEYVDRASAISGIPPEIKQQRQTGVMAQDLASTPLGESMVYEDPQTGMLAIDGGQAVTTSLGLIGRLGERADELEQRLAELEAQRQAAAGRGKRRA